MRDLVARLLEPNHAQKPRTLPPREKYANKRVRFVFTTPDLCNPDPKNEPSSREPFHRSQAPTLEPIQLNLKYLFHKRFVINRRQRRRVLGLRKRYHDSRPVERHAARCRAPRPTRTQIQTVQASVHPPGPGPLHSTLVAASFGALACLGCVG